jgi:Tol biopolymer transport system component
VWYTYDVNSGKTQNLSGTPADISDNVYVYSPDSSAVAYTQLRDGKLDLYVSQSNGTKETKVSQTGYVINYSWVNNQYLVFQVASPDGSSVYIAAANGSGESKVANAYLLQQNQGGGR